MSEAANTASNGPNWEDLFDLLRAWIDRDEVRVTNMAVNSEVWEELAAIDHGAAALRERDGSP